MLTRRHAAAIIPLLCALVAPACSEFSSGSSNENLGCGTLFFAFDPVAHECRPILACSRDADSARDWDECNNPCENQQELACAADSRCQRVFAERQLPDAVCLASNGGDPSSCPPSGSQVRTYIGCRALESRRSCDQLDPLACSQNPTCTAVLPTCSCETDIHVAKDIEPGEISCVVVNCVAPLSGPLCQARSCMALDGALCQARTDCTWDGASCRAAAALPCGGLTQTACLARRDCRPVGQTGYCPSGMTCASHGGGFVRCEDDRPADGSCFGDSDCGPGNRCTQTAPCAATACAGRCAPETGCATLNEAQCSQRPECAPKFREVCAVRPGTPPGPQPQPGSPYNPGGGGNPMGPIDADAGVRTSTNCITVEAFAGCIDLRGNEIIPDRSLLILEPSVLDEPELSFSNLMTRLAGDRDPTPMLREMLATYVTTTTINGRAANPRAGVNELLANIDITRAEGLRFRPVAISNRLDLVSATGCGEARIVYATDFGAFDPRFRMTIILEFGVPLDGLGCRTWAQRWASLSQFATRDPAFKQRVLLLASELFQANRLNQLRSNELFGKSFGASDWELREFHLVGGHLVPQPCTNSPDTSVVRDPAFLSWVTTNQTALALGTASVPTAFLAATSVTVPAARLTLPLELRPFEKPLNHSTCNGCHSTETDTQFVHLTERHFRNARSKPSAFLHDDLANRGEILRTLLGDSSNATVLRTRDKPNHH